MSIYGLVPYEPATLELATGLRLVQPQRFPRHRPERLARGAAGVTPVEPGLPADRPVHAEAVWQVGAHGVKARVDRGPRVLELHLEKVLLREAIADSALVELPVARTPMGHRPLDARDHVLETRAVGLDDQQPAIDAAGDILVRGQLEERRRHGPAVADAAHVADPGVLTGGSDAFD